MRYISLGDNYDGVRLSINTFEKKHTPRIWDLLEQLTNFPLITGMEQYKKKHELMKEIATEMENIK
jgi:hypothetical protein